MQEQLDDEAVAGPAILTTAAGIVVGHHLAAMAHSNAPSLSRPHLRASSSQAADVSASTALLGATRSTPASV